MTNDLVKWLREQIAEDEQYAGDHPCNCWQTTGQCRMLLDCPARQRAQCEAHTAILDDCSWSLDAPPPNSTPPPLLRRTPAMPNTTCAVPDDLRDLAIAVVKALYPQAVGDVRWGFRLCGPTPISAAALKAGEGRK